MLVSPDGRIKMAPDEEMIYLAFSAGRALPKSWEEFDRVLKGVARSMRQRIAIGIPQAGDSPVMANLIEIYLRDPHVASIDRCQREWAEAGHPIGADAMRAAGLTSAALDFFEEQDAPSGKSG